MIISHDCEELKKMESDRNEKLNDFQKALARLVKDPLSDSLTGLDSLAPEATDSKASA